jgi:hypothetical protein
MRLKRPRVNTLLAKKHKATCGGFVFFGILFYGAETALWTILAIWPRVAKSAGWKVLPS